MTPAMPQHQSIVAVLGAGMMGAAIAAAHLRCGVSVRIYDSVPAALHSTPQRVAEELRLQNVPFDPAMLDCHDDLRTLLRDAGPAPILIETITEKLRAKHKLYRQVVESAPEGTEPGLFSNTSTIAIRTLAEPLDDDHRARFLGFHFFHPVRQRSLLEIIPSRYTNPETLETAKRHALRIEKQPIIVADGPGFLVNRILNPYLTTALQLLEGGVDPQRIERLATDFGMKMGPLRIMDEIGLDVVLHSGWVLFKAFPDRVPQSPLLLNLIDLGRLGRKTGRGFMLYPNATSWNGDGVPDHELPLPPNKELREITDEEIIDRLFRSMHDEACRCLADGIVANPADIDLASIHALGFPEEKLGVYTWGKQATRPLS